MARRKAPPLGMFLRLVGVAIGCGVAALVGSRLDPADPNRAIYIVLTAVAIIGPWDLVVWYFFIRGKERE